MSINVSAAKISTNSPLIGFSLMREPAQGNLYVMPPPHSSDQLELRNRGGQTVGEFAHVFDGYPCGIGRFLRFYGAACEILNRAAYLLGRYRLVCGGRGDGSSQLGR